MQIQNALVHLALEARFIVTTGGTGIADVMFTGGDGSDLRSIDRGRRRAHATRRNQEDSVCGVEPGSVRRARQDADIEFAGQSGGAVESLQAVVELIPHALDLLDGKTEH